MFQNSILSKKKFEFFVDLWGIEPASLGLSSERYTNCAMTDQLGETLVRVLRRFIEDSVLRVLVRNI